jgi:hypothetical protein
MILSINGVDVSDLVQGMKIGYETLVSEEGSGRNAQGDMVIDVINRKVKVYASFRPMSGSDMSRLLGAMDDYVVNVSFRDSKTNATRTITAYTGTPTPDYYWVLGNQALYKAFDVNFIEL